MKLPNFEEMTIREVIELRDALDDFFNKFGPPRRNRTPYGTYDFNATAHTSASVAYGPEPKWHQYHGRVIEMIQGL